MIKGIIFDLDGTVYLGEAEVPGAARFTRDVGRLGIRCLYVTNRANRSAAEICSQLNRYGIGCTEDDVLTSAQATVQYLARGSAFYIGEEAVGRLLAEYGFRVTDTRPDYVIVSFDRRITPEKIRKAAALIREGAMFVATNPDKALKIEAAVLPGTGTIVDAVAAEAGRAPDVVIGKPERLIIDMAVRRMGLEHGHVIMVGDNVETDIPAGAKAGVRTVLILTGVSTRADLCDKSVQPTWIVESYDELMNIVVSSG